MRVTAKGQITIPQEIREKMDFFPDTEVEFEVSGRKVFLKKAGSPSKRGKNLIARMRGKATVKMTTDEIMTLTRR